jgi:DNA-binding SARP family transcriptional activator
MPGSNGSNIPVSTSPALRTLGGAALLDATTGATILGPGKPLALVAYLALSPGHAATREFLTDLLWADLEADRARHALRQALWQVRHILGESAFTGRDELRLALPIASDRDDFLTAMERGDCDRAVDLYTGPFLPDLAVPGGVEFEHWADLERDRLRAMFLRSCEMATRRKLASSQFRDAQRIARRARDADPSNELGWRLLLESLSAGQDFITATLEADALEARAAAELRELEPATRATVRMARRVSEGAPRREPELVADLIGREREYAIILDACERATSGPATHVHLAASAGLGKTRLLNDVRARLSAAGKRVVSIRAHPGERQIPFAMASELARAAAELPGVVGISPASAAALVALNPALSSRFNAPPDGASGDDALRNRAIALTEALMAAAEEAPFALLIDDLHWADPASRQLLDGVLARLDGARVAVVTASRPVREALPAIDTTTTLALPPLTGAQVASFVTSLGALPRGEAWAAGLEQGLHLATSGSPLLLLQLLKLALERGVLSLGEAGWNCADPDALGRMLREGEAMRNRLDALSREQRWLVTTLAVAGIPLGGEALAHASSRPLEAVVPDLEALERIGLVLRSGPNWDLAHDEIGAVASEGLTDTAEHTAHRGIGGALLADSCTDPVLLIRAARHLSAAGDHEGLAQCAQRYVRSAWARGDGRSPGQLVSELLGRAGDPDTRARVSAGLPVRWRIGLWNRTRLATATLAATLATLLVGARMLSPAPAGGRAELLLFTRDPEGQNQRVVPVDLSDWNTAQPLRMLGPRPKGFVLPPEATSPAPSPDGSRLLFTMRTGDVTTDDLMLLEGGKVRRLTHEPRDDNNGAWSPNGRWIAFLTARWSERGADDYDVAVIDPATGAVRQLTTTRDWDLRMSWSPDGSRLAFARRYRLQQSPSFCTVSFDGLDEACRTLAGYQVMDVIGWQDPATVLVEAEQLDGRAIVSYHLDTGAQAVVAEGDLSDARVSPDGAWLAMTWARSTTDVPSLWVMPVGAPSQARRVDSLAGLSGPVWQVPDPSAWLDSLAIGDLSLPVDGVGTVSLSARDARGRPLSLPWSALRWSVDDTTIAAVDARSGHVSPKRPGSTTITVSAGGWREATARLSVTGTSARTVLLDSLWENLDTSRTATGRWRLYGDPLPRRVDSTGGPAVSNNGDGVYSSGIYSREAFPAQSGLGVEVELSVPVTRPQWQMQGLILTSTRSQTFEPWDHRSGGPPPALDQDQCSFVYPGGEGAFRLNRIQASAVGMGKPLAVAEALADGRWFTVRVQIFTDGRCGFAVNGAPLWVSPTRVPVDLDYRVMLGGNSAGTTVRIRKVEMWEGVRGDVRW